MAVQVPAETQNISDMKIVMNREWLNPPVDRSIWTIRVSKVVESMPEFPGGGMTAMMQLLKKYQISGQCTEERNARACHCTIYSKRVYAAFPI